MNITFVLQIFLPSNSIEVKSRLKRYNPPFPNVLCNFALWHLFTNLPHYIIISLFMFGIKNKWLSTARTFSLENFVKNWVLIKTELSTIIMSKITLKLFPFPATLITTTANLLITSQYTVFWYTVMHVYQIHNTEICQTATPFERLWDAFTIHMKKNKR